MERLNKCKLLFGAVRCHYSVPKPPVSYFTHLLPLVRQPHSSICFRNLTKSCGFSSSSYFRQRFSQREHLNQFDSDSQILPLAPVPVTILLAAFAGYLLGPDGEDVPYIHRKRFVICTDFLARKVGEEKLQDMKKSDFKGKILPSDDPRSVKVSSILKKVLDTLYKDLELDEIPRVTYHGLADSVSSEDTSLEQGKSSERETNISHLKGRKWEFLVVDKPQDTTFCMGDGVIVVYTGLLDAFSDLGIATALAHEVGHCVARHGAESLSYDGKPMPSDFLIPAFREESIEYMKRRQEIEANYISLRLMASAGHDPHDVLQVYDKLETFCQNNEIRKERISREERIQELSQPHVMEKACAIYRKTTGSK